MLIDYQGNVWVGTSGGGLNMYDRKNNTFIHYKHNPDDPKSLSNNLVKSIYEDHAHNIWAGTNGNVLNLLNREDKTFTRYKPKQSNGSTAKNVCGLRAGAMACICLTELPVSFKTTGMM